MTTGRINQVDAKTPLLRLSCRNGQEHFHFLGWILAARRSPLVAKPLRGKRHLDNGS